MARLAGEPCAARCGAGCGGRTASGPPALAEGVGEVADGGPADLELEVVPRRTRAVPGVEVDRLRVAVGGARRRGGRGRGRCRRRRRRRRRDPRARISTSFWWWLPPRRTRSSSSSSPPASLTSSTSVGVVLLGEVRLTRVRAPEQPADVDAAAGEVGEHRADLGARTVETLVGVALPVGEVHPVARVRGGRAHGGGDGSTRRRRRAPRRGCPSVHARPSSRRRSIAVAALPRSSGRQEPVGGHRIVTIRCPPVLADERACIGVRHCDARLPVRRAVDRSSRRDRRRRSRCGSCGAPSNPTA